MVPVPPAIIGLAARDDRIFTARMMSHATRPAALVLGAAVWPGGEPSPTLRRRARHAANLFAQGAVSHVIGCGGLGRHPPSEAAVIRAICMAAGVPETAILCEDRSRSTLENIENALPLLRGLGCPPVVIVTDRYHAGRARLVARHFGLEATASCPDQVGTPKGRLLRSWLREIPALLAYALRLGLSGRRRR